MVIPNCLPDLDLLDNSLDFIGVKSAFEFFGTTKEKFIKNCGIDIYHKPIYLSPGVYHFPPK